MQSPNLPFDKFLSGLLDHSPKCLLLGLLGGLIGLAVIEVGFSSGVMWRLSPQWLLANQVDDWTLAVWQVNRLRRQEKIDKHIFLFGGSSAREALENNQSVSSLLQKKTGTPYQFINFGTRRQSFAETVMLIDNLPAASSSLIIFGIQPTQLRYDRSEVLDAYQGMRYPLHSVALGRILEDRQSEPPFVVRLNVFRFRDWFGNFLKQRISDGNLFRPLRYVNHLYRGRQPLTKTQLRSYLSRIETEMTAYPIEAGLNLEMLKAAIEMANDKGYQVLVTALPRNPVADELIFAPYLTDYQQRLKALNEHADVFDFGAGFEIPAQAFFDHVHLVDDARAAFQEVFTDVVAGYLIPQ